MQRKWFQKKRYWILMGMLLVVFLLSRLELLNVRYQPFIFAQSISANHSDKLVYKNKRVATVNMNYCQLGSNKHLPVVVLVHGSPGSLAAYESYLKDTLLNQKAILIAVDRLGFGYSDFGKTMPSLSTQAQPIAAILQDFPNQKKIVVGHSMGGPVISRLAIDYPQLVDGLVLVAPSISPALEPSNRWRKVIDFPIFRFFTPAAFRVCNQEIIPLKEELLAMESNWKTITCPVTVIQGTADPLVPAGNAIYAKEQLINSPKVELKMIEEGNHFILWSEQQFIRDAILELVAEI